MRLVTRSNPRSRRRLAIMAITGAVLVGAALGGRHLLQAATTASSGPAVIGSMPAGGAHALPIRPSSASELGAPRKQAAITFGKTGAASASTATVPGASSSALPGVPKTQPPSGPLVVKTASASIAIGPRKISRVIGEIGSLAQSMGGYVDSQSTSGGNAKHGPTGAQLAIRVQASDFEAALAHLGSFGRLTNESVKSQDVTGQVADLGAEIQILQAESHLLGRKLVEAGSTASFLQIEGQLTSVNQQLQGLQAQQGVLSNFAALATIDVTLSATGVPAATRPAPHPDGALVAWRYASHNSLVVLDALAAGLGWALPLLVLGGLVWLGVDRVRRRRRVARPEGPAPAL